MAVADGVRVLLIDDEPSSLNLSKEYLKEVWGFNVLTALTASKALEVLGSESVDVIVSDHQMPGMTGLELLKKIRSEGSDLPFILFTGRGRESVVIEALNSGADFYLQKGMDVESAYAELAHKVRSSVTRRRDEVALRLSHKRETLLADVASRLLQSPDPQRIIDDLARQTMKALDCDVFFNYLLDEEKGRLNLNAWGGIPESEANRLEWLDYGASVCGCVALEGQRIVAEDILHSEDQRTDLVRSFGVQAYACHPLMVEGKSIGTLSFGTRSRKAFTPEELSIMNTVTDHIAIAMQRIIIARRDRAREQLYRSILNNIDEGFCLMEVLRDVGGKAMDLRFLEVNDQFRKDAFWSGDNIGRTVKEIEPEISPVWIELNGKVEQTGEPMWLEGEDEETSRRYRSYHFRFSKGVVGILLGDITGRGGTRGQHGPDGGTVK